MHLYMHLGVYGYWIAGTLLSGNLGRRIESLEMAPVEI
jgi:hypothetical protein